MPEKNTIEGTTPRFRARELDTGRINPWVGSGRVSMADVQMIDNCKMSSSSS